MIAIGERRAASGERRAASGERRAAGGERRAATAAAGSGRPPTTRPRSARSAKCPTPPAWRGGFEKLTTARSRSARSAKCSTPPAWRGGFNGHKATPGRGQPSVQHRRLGEVVFGKKKQYKIDDSAVQGHASGEVSQVRPSSTKCQSKRFLTS